MPIEFVPAICPNCGGELRIPDDRKTVKCMYCGYDIIIIENKDNSSQQKIENWLKLADSVMATNPEESLEYYSKVLEVDPENYIAWIGRGNSTGRLSSLIDLRLAEAMDAFHKAIDFSPEEEKLKVRESTTESLYIFASNYYIAAAEFYNANSRYDEAYFQFCERCKLYFTFVDYILEFFPELYFIPKLLVTNITIIDTLIEKIPMRLMFNINNPSLYLMEKLKIYVKLYRKFEPEYKAKYIKN